MLSLSGSGVRYANINRRATVMPFFSKNYFNDERDLVNERRKHLRNVIVHTCTASYLNKKVKGQKAKRKT